MFVFGHLILAGKRIFFQLPNDDCLVPVAFDLQIDPIEFIVIIFFIALTFQDFENMNILFEEFTEDSFGDLGINLHRSMNFQ
jgi:hypothetical protein